jgi:predicted ester cyclase
MTEQSTTIARKFFESQDQRRGGPAPELLADGYTAHVSAYPVMDGAGHDEFAGMFYGAFPDLVHHIEEVVGLGDRVAVRFRITGTNTESFMGMPATGKPIDINALGLLTIDGSKVKDIYGAFDELGMMQQIGAIPAQVG